MTQVHYDSVPLDDLVHRSHGVFVVEPAAPATRVEQISILPEGSEFEGRNESPFYEPSYHDSDPGPHLDKNYPPYPRVWHRVVITEVLKHPGSEAPETGDTLELCEGNSGSQESLHRRYYLDGMRKSPIYPCYRSDAELDDSAPRIAFASRQHGAWHLTVAWAFEAAARRNEVAKIIADGSAGNMLSPKPS